MMDPFSLSGKTVLVTGSSSGIGLAVAQAAARDGAKVVINGRNPDKVAAALASLEGDGHIALQADLTSEEAVKDLVEACPVLDGLVLNAGIFPRLTPFNMADARHIAEVMNANFLAPVNLMNLLLRKRKLANGASVVINTATAGIFGPGASAAYAASKAALTGAARSIALDVGKKGIRVNCVAPGYVKTELTHSAVAESQFDFVPLGVAEPPDLAGPFLFLLSGASRWITRSTLIADGGISLKIPPMV
jgi:NAD(P)-dependent dehydrogenase (short-subunit alcohol dehydrogenase family)